MVLATAVLSQDFHVGDVGTELIVEFVEYDEDTATWVVVDISAATTLTIYLTKSTGTTLTKTAVFDTDGTDGLAKYTTISGDFSIKGTYRIEGFAAGIGGWSGSTREATFQVLASRHG